MRRMLLRLAIVAVLTLALALVSTGIVFASMLVGPDDPSSRPPVMPHPSLHSGAPELGGAAGR